MWYVSTATKQMLTDSRSNHIDLGNLDTINVKDHSTYIDVAKEDAGTVIEKSVFSVASYRGVLQLKGGDMAKFDKEIGTKFKKSAKGLQALVEKKSPLTR